MSLDVLITSVMKDLQTNPYDEGEKAALEIRDMIVKEFEDTPIRAEIFERIQYDVNEGVTIADVHIMMDALVRVLKGD